jgi:hypothetical protein
MRRSNQLSPRLLTKAEAAAYCGVSVGAFFTRCPVRPIAMSEDKRLERYDVVELDKWIDSLKAHAPKRGSAWLETMDDDDDQSSGEGDPTV